MDLASFRTISIFFTHVFCVCVIIDAQGLSSLPQAEGAPVGALCGLQCPRRPGAGKDVKPCLRPTAGLQDKKPL